MPAPTGAGPGSIWISRVISPFSNVGRSSDRVFNDLGVIEVESITFETRTGTATFIGQDAGSALQFGNGAFIRTTNVGLFRFGRNCGCADVDGSGDLDSLDVTLFTEALLDATACP